ncbi:glycoside hydrolase family 5 protein [Tulasnella calospora MUT 4182]|uniref:Glycoside hydrolase family 5 protein n=1 Tax=Tulasnella calospora MUT 4182 TaxID=1051891 RepID=A0A0C3MAQ6_9AGAM|nr:glycoside hydrolase family 5 protein [Tulasnella calospora MUT 4182]
MLNTVITVAALAKLGFAAVPMWGQCGGLTYTGDTTCVADWYWQCLASTSAPSSTTSKTSTTTSKTSSTTSTKSSTTTTTTTTKTSSTTTKTSSTTTTSSTSVPSSCAGFVGISGQKFTLNGNTYTVVGSNAYWLAQFPANQADLDQAFADIAATGATTVRTLYVDFGG